MINLVKFSCLLLLLASPYCFADSMALSFYYHAGYSGDAAVNVKGLVDGRKLDQEFHIKITSSQKITRTTELKNLIKYFQQNLGISLIDLHNKDFNAAIFDIVGEHLKLNWKMNETEVYEVENETNTSTKHTLVRRYYLSK